MFAETPYPRDDGTLFVADPLAPGAWRPLVNGLGALRGTTHILHLWSLDAVEGSEPDLATGWPAVVGLAQELASQGAGARVHLVTRGAVKAPDPASAAVGGGMWGIAGLLASELPGLFGGVVDLDPDDEDADALLRHLLQAVGAPGGAHAFRGGTRFRRGLAQGAVPAPGELDATGAWVLAGDIDVPALELAGRLADAGVKRIYMLTAAAPPAEVLKHVLDLQRKGVGCVVVRGDLTEQRDRDAVRQRLAKEARVSGVVVRSAAAPSPLRELPIGEALTRWRRGVDGLELLLALAPDAPVWAWCEGRAMDGAPGAGVAAPLGASLGARLQCARRGPSGVLHTGPASRWQPGQAVRLLLRLASAGGVAGAWR